MAALELSATNLFYDPNLVAYYKLENNSDSKDSFTLVNNNSVTFVSALFNNGAEFGSANTNKFLSIGSNLGIDGGPITIMGWVFVNTNPTSGNAVVPFSQAGSVTSSCYQVIVFNDAGTMKIGFFRITNSQQGTTYTAHDLSGGWHLVALTYDGATVFGYVDGTATDAGGAASGSGSGGFSDEFQIAANRDQTVFASMKADDVAVFSRALTATEISNHYNGLDAAFSPNLNDASTVSEFLGHYTDLVIVTEDLTINEFPLDKNLSVDDSSTLSEVVTARETDLIDVNDSSSVTENLSSANVLNVNLARSGVRIV